MPWFRLQCPNCHRSTLLTLGDADKTVQCCHCRRHFGRHSLRMLYPGVGGLRELNKAQARRAELRNMVAGLRDAADEIEAEIHCRGK